MPDSSTSSGAPRNRSTELMRPPALAFVVSGLNAADEQGVHTAKSTPGNSSAPRVSKRGAQRSASQLPQIVLRTLHSHSLVVQRTL
jgi:hypothetical protein